MNIGNKYSDNKIYRGVNVGNGLPLLAEDLVEISDTIANKNKYLLDNILGSGVIKELEISYDSFGVLLNSPAILNIEGDICLIKNSTGRYFMSISEMYHPSARHGIICVVGWYQHISADSTKEYGGVQNEDVPTYLIHPTLGKVSSRYQFRWDTAVVFTSDSDNITSIHIPLRNADGEDTGLAKSIGSLTKKGSIYIAKTPAEMDYAEDNLYIIPLIKYTTSETSERIESITGVNIRRPNSSGSVIKSTTTPQGKFYDGQEWFNPDTLEFKTYVEGVGFVANTTKTGFVRYQQSFTIPADNITHMNLTDLPIIQDTDILEVIYEGLQLSKDVDFHISSSESVPVIEWLINPMVGEKFVVNITRLVEASNVTSLTTELTKHTSSKANSTTCSHVKLSDSISSTSDINSGVAATPKAVRESRILKDSTAGKSYILSVDNGVLYIENMSTGVKKSLMSNLL